MSPDDAREKLLDAILPNVPFDGWTHKALSAGAADLNLDPLELDRLFPGGPADVIECFSARADRQMLQGLGALELESMRVRDKVATAVRLRLEALEPHREAVQRGLTFLGLRAASTGPSTPYGTASATARSTTTSIPSACCCRGSIPRHCCTG
jgi:ubiquinone biosynthesis protein COQ9